jgi:hypothetical protein
MNVGAGRVDAKLHAQRATQSELSAQLMLADNLRGAFFKRRESFIRLHDP